MQGRWASSDAARRTTKRRPCADGVHVAPIAPLKRGSGGLRRQGEISSPIRDHKKKRSACFSQRDSAGSPVMGVRGKSAVPSGTTRGIAQSSQSAGQGSSFCYIETPLQVPGKGYFYQFRSLRSPLDRLKNLPRKPVIWREWPLNHQQGVLSVLPY